jgi:hypothetical protein
MAALALVDEALDGISTTYFFFGLTFVRIMG